MSVCSVIEGGDKVLKILDYKMNAIMAKSRALYGKRLTKEDYGKLVECKTLSEFVTYLKTHTSYGEILREISSYEPEIGLIEFLIKEKNYLQFTSLYHYEVTLGADFSDYFLIEEEVKQILLCLKNILLGSGRKYIIQVPDFYKKIFHFDIEALMNVSSLDELSVILSGTPYKKIIDNGIKNKASYIEFECAMYNYFCERECAIIKNKAVGTDEIMALLKEKFDLQFINNLYRLKKYFPENKVIISTITPGKMTAFSKKQIKDLISADDEKAVIELLKKTAYKKYAYDTERDIYPELAIEKIKYQKYKKMLRFSTNPNTVMFCFIFLMENEANNLIHIAEGIRYSMQSESIKALLYF